MKVFIKKHENNAGFWIYEGYKKAWESLGFDTFYYKNLSDLKEESGFYLMSVDSDIKNYDDLKIIEKSNKTFLFVLPNYFIKHWNTHPNWVTSCQYIKEIKEIKNIIKWSFLEKCDYYESWGEVKTISLAYDDNLYKYEKDINYKFDVCYVGTWANNGFNEKRKNIISHFSELKKTKLNCALLINKNVSNQEEIKLLSNSKISLNIHDTYQRELGLDTNERTFKSLGLNGVLVSDYVQQIKKITCNIKMSNNPKEYVELIYEYINDPNLENIRQQNIDHILKNHTYKNRVQEFLNV